MDLMDKSLLRPSLPDNDEVQQLFDLINKDPKISDDFSVDWIEQMIPHVWEDQIPCLDDKLSGLNNLGGALNDYLMDEKMMGLEEEGAAEDALNESHFEGISFRIFDNYIKEEFSKDDDYWDMVEKITSSDGGSAPTGSRDDTGSSDSGCSKDATTSIDSCDSGGGGSSQSYCGRGGSSSDDSGSSSSDSQDWFDHVHPIVVRPDIQSISSSSDDEAENDAENEEIDVINFIDDRTDMFGGKARRRMTVTENIQCDHSYYSRVQESDSPTTASSSHSVRHLPSQQKSKCSRSSKSSLNTVQHLPRKQNSKEKCGRRKVVESSRTISNAKRHSRGRILKNASEKRQQLNQMERIRRGGLKIDFQRLRLVVPETSSDPKAPKDKILQYALTTIITLEESCKLFEEERERLRHQQNVLRRCLKQNSGTCRKVNRRV